MLTQLLGLIMSDWTGVYSTAESLKAGLDLEMPFVSDYLALSFYI